MFSFSSILLFRSFEVRFTFSASNKFTSWKSVTYAILRVTVLNISASPGIVTITIGSRVEVSTGCPRAGVLWVSKWRRGTECSLCYGYLSCSSPLILWVLFWATFTHSWRVFPHKIVHGNSTTTFSVSIWHIRAVATEVNVFPRPISSSTSGPGISESQTHLLTMNHTAQTGCARNLVPGRCGIESMLPGTRSSIISRISQGFWTPTASWRHSRSNLSLIELRIVTDTELVLSRSRTSSPSASSCTAHSPELVVFAFTMIGFSFSDVCWTDWLIPQQSWNPSWC